MKRTVLAALVFTLGALFAPTFSSPAFAVPLISNLNTADAFNGTAFGSPSRSKVMGFAMPSGADYILDSVILRLQTLAGEPVIDPVVQIWSNSASNLPAASLITLIDPVFTATAGIANYTFTPGGSFTLLADTIYWLFVGTTNGTNFAWRSGDESIAPTGIASHFGQLFDDDGPPPTGDSSFVNVYQINATAVDAAAVPEPGTMALLAFGFPALAMARRRRRTSKP